MHGDWCFRQNIQKINASLLVQLMLLSCVLVAITNGERFPLRLCLLHTCNLEQEVCHMHKLPAENKTRSKMNCSMAPYIDLSMARNTRAVHISQLDKNQMFDHAAYMHVHFGLLFVIF
jgi:hypothetical protein